MADKKKQQIVSDLISVSKLFSPSEALEWLKLVPLMNDSQLWEVRRILESAQDRQAGGSEGGFFVPAQDQEVVVLEKQTNDTFSTKKEQGSSVSMSRIAGVAEHQIKTLEDLSTLTSRHLRAWGEEGLFTAIKAVVKENSWPVARMELESSPLFRAYVDTGRQGLGGGLNGEEVLEKSEFEAVADLLARLSQV